MAANPQRKISAPGCSPKPGHTPAENQPPFAPSVVRDVVAKPVPSRHSPGSQYLPPSDFGRFNGVCIPAWLRPTSGQIPVDNPSPAPDQPLGSRYVLWRSPAAGADESRSLPNHGQITGGRHRKVFANLLRWPQQPAAPFRYTRTQVCCAPARSATDLLPYRASSRPFVNTFLGQPSGC